MVRSEFLTDVTGYICNKPDSICFWNNAYCIKIQTISFQTIPKNGQASMKLSCCQVNIYFLRCNFILECMIIWRVSVHLYLLPNRFPYKIKQHFHPPTLFVIFSTVSTFVVPAPVPCVRIPGMYSESIYRSRTQWPKEKVQTDKQRLTKHTCFLAIPTKSSIVRQLVPSYFITIYKKSSIVRQSAQSCFIIIPKKSSIA